MDGPEREEAMRVEDMMTKDVCACSPSTDVATAAGLMWSKNCGSLPVVEDGGHITGIVTDRDLLIALGTSNRRASDVPLGEVMSGNIAVCSPADDIHAALKTMAQKRLRRLPVVDSAGVLRGIVSIADMALRADQELAIDVLGTIKAICDRRDRNRARRELLSFEEVGAA